MSKAFTLMNSLAALPIDNLTEGYSKTQMDGLTMFVVNVSAEHLGYVFISLCDLVEGYSYITIEHDNLKENPPTRDTYFLTDVLHNEFLEIFSLYHRIILDCPMVSFGYASHLEEDEVYLEPYKTLRIFTSRPQKYEELLQRFEYQKKDYLVTASEALQRLDKTEEKSKDQEKTLPSSRITSQEIDEMIEELMHRRLRFAKRQTIVK